MKNEVGERPFLINLNSEARLSAQLRTLLQNSVGVKPISPYQTILSPSLPTQLLSYCFAWIIKFNENEFSRILLSAYAYAGKWSDANNHICRCSYVGFFHYMLCHNTDHI